MAEAAAGAVGSVVSYLPNHLFPPFSHTLFNPICSPEFSSEERELGLQWEEVPTAPGAAARGDSEGLWGQLWLQVPPSPAENLAQRPGRAMLMAAAICQSLEQTQNSP